MLNAVRAAIILIAGAGLFSQGAVAQDDAAAPEAAAPETESDGRYVGPNSGEDIFKRDDYTLTPIICPFKGKVKYKPGEISCGLFTVPENRERPRSRKIQLHYVKIAARQPKDWDEEKDGKWMRRADPIIYLTGGPGAQATGYVERFKDHGIRDHRDLYILEQRGIGFSQDFCPLYSLIDPAASNTGDYDAYQRAGLRYMEACFSTAKARGVDLSGYNTIENARDVHALRKALGFEQWNVWGISYGSYLGQAYIKEDPEGIRTVVLDAIAPLEPRARFQKIGPSYQRDLDLLQKACNENETCGKDFPNLVERYKAAIVKVRDTGPIKLKAIDTELFPSGDAYFYHDIIGGAPFIQLYEQKNYAALPAFISSFTAMVEKDDYEAFRLLTSGGGGPGFTVSQGMYNAIACNDNWVSNLREVLEEDRLENPVLSSLQGDPALADEIVAICKRYGMPGRPAEQYASTETAIRTVIANGQMDPITPPPFAQMIMPGFSNGTYVEFPYAGHGPTRSVKCAGDFLTKFYDNPDGELDRSCADEMKAPDFVGQLYETKGITRLATLAAEDENAAAIAIVWIGFAAFILIFGALIYTFAPIARLINRSEVMTTGGARLVAWLTAIAGTASVGGLAYAIFASGEASQFILLVGLLPVARWFVIAGLAAGALGLLLLLMTVAARRREPLPIGVLSGLFMTALGGVLLGGFLLAWGFMPM